MGKGQGSGPGRPRKQLPGKETLLAELLNSKDRSKCYSELASKYGCSEATIRRRINEKTGTVSNETSSKQAPRPQVPPTVHTIRSVQEALPEKAECKVPPPGWYCTREAGHEGPCAARQINPIEMVCTLCSNSAPEGQAIEHELTCAFHTDCACGSTNATIQGAHVCRVNGSIPEPEVHATPGVTTESDEDSTEDEVLTGNTLLYEEDYTYNKDSDTYITFLEAAPKPVLVPGSKHRAMLQAYSNWDGQPASINEICRQFDFPRNWFVEYKRIHGWTHDLEPVTHEELRDKPLDELVNFSLQMKRQALYRKFSKRDWHQTQAAAENWWDFEQSVFMPLLEKMETCAPLYRPTPLTLKTAENPYAAIFAAFDLHFGKDSWRDENGDSYSREEARSLLFQHTQALASRLAKFGRPERIIVPIGSDWFHIDNPWNETVNGTRQDTDGSYARILMEGTDLAVEYLDYLRQIAPITIVAVDGNHDRASSLSMGMYVRAWFRQNEDVTCIVQPSPRQYIEYGNTLIGFCHGDDVKVAQLSGLMATEAREQWGRCKNNLWFTGHLHHEVVRELDGITQFQLPSLSAADRWHKRKGFCMSKRALSAYAIDSREGYFAELISPVLNPQIPYGFKLPGRTLVSNAIGQASPNTVATIQ